MVARTPTPTVAPAVVDPTPRPTTRSGTMISFVAAHADPRRPINEQPAARVQRSSTPTLLEIPVLSRGGLPGVVPPRPAPVLTPAAPTLTLPAPTPEQVAAFARTLSPASSFVPPPAAPATNPAWLPGRDPNAAWLPDRDPNAGLPTAARVMAEPGPAAVPAYRGADPALSQASPALAKTDPALAPFDPGTRPLALASTLTAIEPVAPRVAVEPSVEPPVAAPPPKIFPAIAEPSPRRRTGEHTAASRTGEHTTTSAGRRTLVGVGPLPGDVSRRRRLSMPGAAGVGNRLNSRQAWFRLEEGDIHRRRSRRSARGRLLRRLLLAVLPVLALGAGAGHRLGMWSRPFLMPAPAAIHINTARLTGSP
jgi:hypothetical protein